MWAVYDLIVDGSVVYVGCSGNPQKRLYWHRARKKVPPSVTMRIVRRFRQKWRAHVAEAARIELLSPPLNVLHRADLKEKARRERRERQISEALSEVDWAYWKQREIEWQAERRAKMQR